MTKPDNLAKFREKQRLALTMVPSGKRLLTRRTNKTRPIHPDTVERLAAQGKTVNEIAAHFNVSRSVFMRRKQVDRQVAIAYNKGRTTLATKSGMVLLRTGSGQTMVTKPPAAPAPVIQQVAQVRPQDAVVRYLSVNRVANWATLKRELRLSDDTLSDVLAELHDTRIISIDTAARTYSLRIHREQQWQRVA